VTSERNQTKQHEETSFDPILSSKMVCRQRLHTRTGTGSGLSACERVVVCAFQGCVSLFFACLASLRGLTLPKSYKSNDRCSQTLLENPIRRCDKATLCRSMRALFAASDATEPLSEERVRTVHHVFALFEANSWILMQYPKLARAHRRKTCDLLRTDWTLCAHFLWPIVKDRYPLYAKDLVPSNHLSEADWAAVRYASYKRDPTLKQE
jgi:hypothetical protein